MRALLTDWQVWERQIRAVFPFSISLAPEELQFSFEKGALFLTVKGHLFSVQLVKQTRDFLLLPRSGECPALVLMDHVSAKTAERLRAANQPFMDCSGNAFLNLPGLYLFVSGRKADRSTQLQFGRHPAGKLFKKSGIKLIFLILSDPALDSEQGGDALNSNMRKLAANAGLSIGSVSELFAEMKDRGFLISDGSSRRLVNRRALFEGWLHGYAEYRLRVKQRCFRAEEIGWWESRTPAQDGFYWGGEPAASLLTGGFLSPGKLTLYTTQALFDLIVETNLQPSASGGNVELVEPLPKSEWQHGCVHPLVVYADLLRSGDERNAETAKRIYEKNLRDVIEAS